MGNKNQKVNVTVNLRDSFSGTLKKLEGQLEKIDNKIISPKFEIKGTNAVENLKLSMETIDEVIETLLEILGKNDIKKTKAMIESLSGVETVKVNVNDSEVTKAVAKQKGLSRNQILGLPNLKEQHGGRPFGGASGMDFGHISRNTNLTPRTLGIRRDSYGVNAISEDLFNSSRSWKFGKPVVGQQSGTDAPGIPFGSEDWFGIDSDDKKKTPGRSGLSRLIPSGNLSNQFSSILLAIAASLGTALGGMVATMGATLTAGITIGGLGILGFGENAADSMHLAQVRMRLFGRELFKIFKPASKHFAPVMDQLFETLPHKLGQLVGTFQNLDVFIPTLSSVGSGFINWIDTLFQSMTRLEPIISQLTLRFGGLLGDQLIKLFEWLTVEFYEHQDAMLAIMGAVKSVIVLVIRLAQVWASVMSVFSPVVDFLATIAEYLNNKIPIGILATIVTLVALLTVMGKVAAVVAIIKGMGVAAAIAAWLPSIAAGVAAFQALAASSTMAAIGVGVATAGLSLVAGAAAYGAVKSSVPSMGDALSGSGMPAPGAAPAMGGGGGTVNNYNTYNIGPDTDNSDIQRIKDISKDGTQEYIDDQDRTGR